jgi:hypothetical protein
MFRVLQSVEGTNQTQIVPESVVQENTLADPAGEHLTLLTTSPLWKECTCPLRSPMLSKCRCSSWPATPSSAAAEL